jgi:teichuronic acid exporter
MSILLINKTVKSVYWSAIERFSVQAVQFFISIILARLVAPSEFGLIAMLSIFIAVAQVFVDSGFSSALVQKKNVTELDFCTIFYFSIFISILVYVILFISAPHIALYYSQPLLEPLCKWIGLSLIFQALSVVQIAKLSLLLDFKTQAKASLTAVIVSGLLGTYLAYYDYGVWALLSQVLLNSFLNTFFLWLFTKWIPKFLFSWGSIKSIFSFGSKLLMSGLLHSVYINLYNIVIGRKYAAMHLGYYTQASLIARLPSVSLMAIISRAIYPIQCKIDHEDNNLLNSTFIQYLRMSCYIIFPIMIGLAILSKTLVSILLTDKWLPMAQYLFILCIAYMWIPIMVMNNQILLVKGRTDYFLKAEAIKKVIGIIILLVTVRFGIIEICFGLLIYNLIEISIIIYFSKKVINIGYVKQMKSASSSFFLAVSMGVIMYLALLFIQNVFLKLLLGCLTGILVYILLSKLFKIKEFIFLSHNFKKLINLNFKR